MAMITIRMPPGTLRRSRPKMAARPSTDIITGKEVTSPSCTGRPAPSFLITMPTPLLAISSRNRPIPMPVPWAMPGGEVIQDPLAHAGDADQGKQHTHQEDGAQRDRNAQSLTQYQTERGKGGEGDGATDSHRQLGPQAHQQGAEGGDQTGGHKHRALLKAGGTQHVRHHYDAVDHRQEGGQPRDQLLTHAAAARRNGKIRVQKAAGPCLGGHILLCHN